MRNILALTRRDVRQATSNVMAIIVMFGLVIIPSLFTWFNVIASWDPFANTKNLKVAVASVDEGYESDLFPIRINVGEQVLSELRANEDLDWVITSEEDAVDGTRSGEYYAAIVLPESFSADMLTFYAPGASSTNIDYYMNEKKNALAPKITGQGAEGISSQISEVFTETLGDIALGLVSSLSDHLADDETQAALTRLEARVGNVATQLRGGAQTADMFTALLDTSIPLVESANSLVSATGANFADASNAVGGGAAAVGSLKSTLETATGALADAISSTAAGYDAVGAKVDDLFAKGNQVSADQAAALRASAGKVQQQIDAYTGMKATIDSALRPSFPDEADALEKKIDRAIDRQVEVRDRLNAGAEAIEKGAASAEDEHAKITESLNAAKQAIEGARSAYDDGLRPKLDELSATLSVIDADVASIRNDLAGASSGLSGASGSVVDALTKGKASTEKISESFGKAAGKFDKLQRTLAKAADTGDLTELSEVIGSDPSVLATSLAEPVRVDRTPVFPIIGFGAGMAPLYTILSLWVGALLMTVAIRVDVNQSTLPDRPELSPTQKYLGRYGIFALAGLAQSTIVTLGLILFVQIEPAHPLLLVLSGWVTSIVFTLIIYTTVVAFGNAGKALSVLLLVIQISGSGGAYPLQLLPAWFQNISPFLPATHAINAFRSAIAGVHAGDIWISLGILLLFAIPALLLGLVLRRPLIAFNRGLMEALESTKLM